MQVEWATQRYLRIRVGVLSLNSIKTPKPFFLSSFCSSSSSSSVCRVQSESNRNSTKANMDSVTLPLPVIPSTTHRPPWIPRASATSFHCFHSYSPLPRLRRSPLLAANTLTANSVPPKNGVYTVGDFMTKKEELHVVKPTTTVDEALEALVEHRITGFPVVDDNWKLVGVVSDYDLLALDSISGQGRNDNSMFPEVDSTWKTFNEVQKLLSKTNGKVIGELMTTVPMVVRETTNLEDAARLLLETKFRRLPVVDAEGRLVGIITRGNVVRAALHMKRDSQNKA